MTIYAYAECHYAVSFMLSVTNKSITLNVVMLSVIMLNVVVPQTEVRVNIDREKQI
jgi:hypothetical protein